MKEDFTSFSLRKYMGCTWHVGFLNLEVAENRMPASYTWKSFGSCGLQEEIPYRD